jgi:hypothetical protein
MTTSIDAMTFARTRHPEPLKLAILRYAALLCIANLPYWILGHFYFLDRAWFSVDSAVVALASGLGAGVGLVVLCVSWLADAVTSASRIYFFGSVGSFMDAGRFASRLDLLAFVTWKNLAVLLTFGACAAAGFALMRRRLDWRAVIIVSLPIVLLDVSNGSSYLSMRASRIEADNIASSPLLTVARAIAVVRAPGALGPLPVGESVADVVDVEAWATAHPTRSILFVMVESLGTHRDPVVREWLRSGLLDVGISARYDVVERALPFRGATVAGELRGLCGLAGDYRSLTPELAGRCLPARLAARGWHSVGLHGFSGNMFDRRDWWPHIGLQQVEFAEDMAQRGAAALCGGAFRGACDADLVRRAGEKLRRGRQFVYLLTLNSHLPVSLEAAVAPDEQARCDAAHTGRDVCQLLAIHHTLLHGLHDMLLGLNELPLVVLVGDHAPPFVGSTERDQFIADRVPGVVLVPRSR